MVRNNKTTEPEPPMPDNTKHIKCRVSSKIYVGTSLVRANTKQVAEVARLIILSGARFLKFIS